jgi:hypothetical protein
VGDIVKDKLTGKQMKILDCYPFNSAIQYEPLYEVEYVGTILKEFTSESNLEICTEALQIDLEKELIEWYSYNGDSKTKSKYNFCECGGQATINNNCHAFWCSEYRKY